MPPELLALAGIEGALKKGAEDGRLDGGPIGLGGVDEQGDLIRAEREGGGVFKEAAIEVGDSSHEDSGKGGAGGHVLPEGLEHDRETGGLVFYFFEELEEGVAREEADVFGKHGEEAALEEAGGDFGIVAVLIEGFG